MLRFGVKLIWQIQFYQRHFRHYIGGVDGMYPIVSNLVLRIFIPSYPQYLSHRTLDIHPIVPRYLSHRTLDIYHIIPHTFIPTPDGRTQH